MLGYWPLVGTSFSVPTSVCLGAAIESTGETAVELLDHNWPVRAYIAQYPILPTKAHDLLAKRGCTQALVIIGVGCGAVVVV